MSWGKVLRLSNDWKNYSARDLFERIGIRFLKDTSRHNKVSGKKNIREGTGTSKDENTLRSRFPGKKIISEKNSGKIPETRKYKLNILVFNDKTKIGI